MILRKYQYHVILYESQSLPKINYVLINKYIMIVYYTIRYNYNNKIFDKQKKDFVLYFYSQKKQNTAVLVDITQRTNIFLFYKIIK